MASVVTIQDGAPGGATAHDWTLDLQQEERVTVRELIRQRIYAEVQRFNATEPGYFRGLVRPREAEETLKGWKLREARRIDPAEQFRSALDAFQSNGYFILINDQQVTTLDEEIAITPELKVSFVKLVPLVGG